MQEEEIRLVRIGDIKPHPLNNFFFDDISGDKWEDFKRSIAKGMINRPRLSADLMLVSGHQRIRALKENGASDDDMVSCVIRHYKDENEILRELIETNIQQRGTVSCSAVKLGRIACALEEINHVSCGNPHDKAADAKPDDSPECKKQTEISAMLNQSMSVYHRNKQLAQLPQEYQEMIERGQISPSTGARIIAKMDDASQQKLLKMLPVDVMRRFTQTEIQGYIDQINTLQSNLEFAQKAISGGTEEWLKLSAERDRAVQKARDEFEKASAMRKECKETEKRLTKMQDEWELAQARADGTMFEGTAFTLIDSALNGFIRSLDFIRQKDQPLAGLNSEQRKYINSLFGKSMQLAREVSQILRAA